MGISTNNRISAEQYLLSAETNTPQELLDGEVIVTASPVNAHQRMIGRVYQVLLSIEVWSLKDDQYAFIGRYTSDEVFVSPILGHQSVHVNAIV